MTTPMSFYGDLTGRVALITGANGMIGSATARRLANAGATVCLADREGCMDLVKQLHGNKSRATEKAVDITDSSQVRALVEQCLSVFGKIDILVTVAGVTSSGDFSSISESEWDRVHNINLKGVFLCNQAVIAPMKSNAYGRIVNIGSVLAKNGGNPRPWLNPSEQAFAGNAAYGASKAGVHSLTLYLAKELSAHGITVNAVAPGPIASAMTTTLPPTIIQQIPVGRMGTAEEVAEAIAFLCADGSGFITGEILDINGGLWTD